MLNWTIQIVNSREFCSLMVKRDHEKEPVEDLKQAFRVFDKVLVTRATYDLEGLGHLV